MDISIFIIVGVITYIIDRVFAWTMHIRKSKCCGAEIEMQADIKI
jgi:hypothetical protein